ncbi:MAG: recombination regulator RecX [Betaproteobacteria bacterium]|nr:recombination regulator RecX [Betaproteobacteria bacterium]
MKHDPDAPAELKARALRLLAQREHSRGELARKLATHAQSRDALDAVLDALIEKKQLSDERYAEQRVHQLARKYGAGRIARELRAKGVDDETVAAATAAAGASDLERAAEMLRRKFREPAKSREERARRARFLQGRGFSYEIIRSALALSSAGTE